MAQTVSVNIVGDANDLKRALGDADSSLQKFSNSAKAVGDRATSIGRSMTFGLTLPLVGLGKVAFDELQESAAAAAQTEAAIKSTGGAANVTAQQIDDLAQSLLNKTGIDDEAIKSGENLLLTFKNIRNEAGKGNDIFNQATEAVVDLSVAFGKDMQSSAVLVGKALNDPLKGLTALTRVGVSFTDQQKEQIKALVETGDVMGAQKLVLEELTSEVGGSAEAYGKTFAGQLSKTKEELKNAGAQILSSFIPVIKDLAGFALDATKAFQDLPDGAQKVAVGVAALVAAAGPATYVYGAVAKAVSGVASSIEAIHTGFQLGGVAILEFIEKVKALQASQVLLAGALGVGLGALVAWVGYLALSAGPFEKAQDAAEAWGQSLVRSSQGTGQQLDFLRAKQAGLVAAGNALSAAQTSLSNAIKEGQVGAQNYRDRLNEVSKELLNNEARQRVVKDLIGEYKQKQVEAKVADDLRNQGLKDLSDGTTNFTTATDEAKRAIIDLQSAVLAQSGGELGLQQARLNQTEAEQALTQAIKDHGLESDEARAAALNLEQARLSVASATLQAQDATQKLIDVVKEGPAAVQAEITKLEAAKAAYGDTSGKIQEQIDKLNAYDAVINGLPDRKATDIVLNGAYDALAAVDALKAALAALPSNTSIFLDVVATPNGPVGIATGGGG